MSPLTLYLGKLIGIGLLAMCLSLALRPKASLATISAMMNETGLLLVTGIFTMTAGIALVLGHNLWSGPPLMIAVTIIGWVSLLKGLAIIAVPPARLAAVYRVLNYPQTLRLVMFIGAIVGAWMTWAAFTATPEVTI
ncbi:MAG TPA: hypothetical protein VGF71_13645 [Caulobacteraceae bacterium]|jgi:hypothetical protein